MNTTPYTPKDFPALTGDVVTQAHVNLCASKGHALHTVNGQDTGRCPRCGELRAPAVAVEAAEVEAPAEVAPAVEAKRPGRARARYYLSDRAKDQSLDLMRGSGTVRWAVIDRETNLPVDEATTQYEGRLAVKGWNLGVYNADASTSTEDTSTTTQGTTQDTTTSTEDTTMSNTIGNRETSIRLAQDYGVRESNPLWTSEATHENVDYSEGDVPLSDPRLVRIVRLRLLTEPGYPGYDVSYVYGQLADGRFVRVDLGASFLSRRTIKADLIGLAKDAGRFAKGLGLLDDVNVWSILR